MTNNPKMGGSTPPVVNALNQDIMRNNLLKHFARVFLQNHGYINSKEYKDYLHSLDAAKHFNDSEITQSMISNFLRDFYKENESTLDKFHKQSSLGQMYIQYTLKSGVQAPKTQTSYKPKFDLAKGNVVCYNKNNPSEFAQANTRRDARREVAEKFGITQTNVNHCSAEYYEKTYLK